MKLFSIQLIIILTFLASSLFNSHPNKNEFKSNLELRNETIQTLINDI
tara:strand:+ start:447 stop:590 length:144 start_codon:yes stop_codon:yes gene_type:complete